MTNDTEHTPFASGEELRSLTPMALAALGAGQLAFVKPITVEGESAFAVHAADGSPLTVVPSREIAFALIRQNDLEPVSVH